MRKFTRREAIKLAFSTLAPRYLRGTQSRIAATEVPNLTANIPARAIGGLTGSQFADCVSNVDREQRERAILDQFLEGNLPDFLRKLATVQMSYRLAGGKRFAATIFVMPEYLAIGSDDDFLRTPMNLHTAAAIADRFGFMLPTKKIVDAIYDQSTTQFTPHPLPPGPQMTSTEYYRLHNGIIAAQSETRGFLLGALASGHKKDVVASNRLVKNPGRVAIYGWHRAKSDPIQPLSTVHGAGYADYSHGIRLVAKMAVIEGRLRPVHDILRDSVLANVLSDEGPIRFASAFGA